MCFEACVFISYLCNCMHVCLICVDIDVAEPDERSIITYVSLLYDVFPNVPSLEQSLRDNVS